MLGVLALIPCSPAAAGTHIGGALTINDSATPPTAAAPYPSTITVSGEKPIVTAISVRVRAFTHPFPEEVDLLLVGPSGQSVLLMSDLGDEPETNEDFTVSDAAPGPGTAVGGSFRPTDLDDEVGDLDDFPAPAPPGPHGSSLGALVAPTANGTCVSTRWTTRRRTRGPSARGSSASRAAIPGRSAPSCRSFRRRSASRRPGGR